jgi:hypothetical protein
MICRSSKWGERPSAFEDVEGMASRYKVSAQAMSIRLSALGYLTF